MFNQRRAYNIDAVQADFDEQQALLDQIDAALGSIHGSVSRMREIQTQLQFYIKGLKGNTAYSSISEKATEIEEKLKIGEKNLSEKNYLNYLKS